MNSGFINYFSRCLLFNKRFYYQPAQISTSMFNSSVPAYIYMYR